MGLVKVIKAASFEWKSEQVCSTCGTEVELEIADVTRTCGCDPRTDESWDSASWVCPVCQRGNNLEGYKSMPTHIRNTIKGS